MHRRSKCLVKKWHKGCQTRIKQCNDLLQLELLTEYEKRKLKTTFKKVFQRCNQIPDLENFENFQ